MLYFILPSNVKFNFYNKGMFNFVAVISQILKKPFIQIIVNI